MDNLNNKNIFITGATGFLGSELLRRILDNTNAAIFMLVRGRSRDDARARTEGVLRDLYGEQKARAMMKRITVVHGTIEKQHLGLSLQERKQLLQKINIIFHSAAVSSFGMPLDEIRHTNVTGTENVFNFANDCGMYGDLEIVNHISTTYIVGTRIGVCYENEVKAPKGFNNSYEQSKYEAELVVQKYRDNGLPINVYRPGILMGDSQTGRTTSFKMFYKPLHFLAAEIFDEIPASLSTVHSLIPVDSAAEATYQIAATTDDVNSAYHIVSNYVDFDWFVKISSDFFRFKKPKFISIDNFDMTKYTPAQRLIMEPYAPYFNYRAKFDTTNADKVLDKLGFVYPEVNEELLHVMFEYCVEVGYLSKK